MSDKRVTLRMVNEALAEMGYEERLVKAKDYFYFAEGEAASWPETMVCACRLNNLTLYGWLDEHRRLRQQARQHYGVAGYEE